MKVGEECVVVGDADDGDGDAVVEDVEEGGRIRVQTRQESGDLEVDG